MSKKAHTRYKKNMYEKNDYKNMVNRPSKDLQDTNDNYSQLFSETSIPLKEEPNNNNNNNNISTKKPLITCLTEFGNEHIIGIVISIIGAFFLWSMALQISDARKQEKIDDLKEDVVEINSQIKDIKEQYIRKDVFDLRMDNLEEKIEKLDDKIQ